MIIKIIVFIFLVLLIYSFFIKKNLKYLKRNFIHYYIINSFNQKNKYDENKYYNRKKKINKNDKNNLSFNYGNFNYSINLSTYGAGESNKNNLVGEFNFKNVGELKCPVYPRLYRLSNYWNNIWLLGGNMYDGKIYIRRTKDKGKNWSNPIPITFYPNYICSNVNFFELENHDIIISYRAIGDLSSKNPEIKFNRKLCSSISHDGGKTWENLGVIIDNYRLAKKLGKTKKLAIKTCKKKLNIGFFEPFIENINGNITVFYSDDFSPMIMKSIGDKVKDNFRAQNIYTQIFNFKKKKWISERRIIMDGTIKKSPTGSKLEGRISRDGMPVVNKMIDGTYILVFEGTYRDRRYPLLTGKHLKEYHAFEILLSFSKDGIIWSNPVEIYTPKNNLSKASAPYIVSTNNNQIIVSFQTDEDSIRYGVRGDIHSIMKVMISKPGINIKNIDKQSFYALCNCNNSPNNGTSIWNNIMIDNNNLYICSSDNTIKFSEIPLYNEQYKFKKNIKNKLFQN